MIPERISKQNPFVQKIRIALGRPAGKSREFNDVFSGAKSESADLLNRIKSRSALDRKRLLDRLIQRARLAAMRHAQPV